MKKILSVLLLFIAMFMFVACGKDEEKDDKNKNNTGSDVTIDFEVKEDINKEVKLTETGKQGVNNVLVALGCSSEEASQMVEQIVPMIEMARLSDEKVVEIASIVTENKDLLEKFIELIASSEKDKYPMALEASEEEALPITAAEIKQAVKAVKDLYIDATVGTGHVELQGLSISGTVYVNGGGSSSVVFKDCVVGSIEVNYEGVRVNLNRCNGNGWFLLRLSLHDPLLPLNIESNSKGGTKKIATALYEFVKQFDKLDASSLADYVNN